jgi:uncharacterized heparinase superfamily protein
MISPALLWRTLRHLRPRQFTARLAFRLARPRPRTGPPPPRRHWPGPWQPPAGRAPSVTGPTRLRFLNLEGDLEALGWTGQGAEKLWRYNQHYFDDLNALQAGQRRHWHHVLLQRWIAQNPPAGGDGWEPYPTSLRIVNWVKAAASGWPLPEEAWHSLAVQARWLQQRLEWHLLGNHLFANAKALVFAGMAFEGAEADGWLQQGLRILAEQLPEQVLGDGGQFERSPMYHALALEDVLDLLNAAQASACTHLALASALPVWQETAPRMLRWMRAMTHPDGRLAHFNDGAHGIAPDAAGLERYAAAVGVKAEPLPESGLMYLAESGYLRAARGPALLLADAAPVGPDYLPGHAHADTLSFELSVGGRRVVVNGGTSRYGLGPERLRERGTAAHSTVQVAGQDSSEVWAGFRVGRRAYPRDIAINGWTMQAAHDGYAHLPGRPVHQRLWRLHAQALQVHDFVDTRGPAADAVARYHLAPGLTLQTAGEGAWWVMDQATLVARVVVEEGEGQVQPSRHAPAFGVVVPTQMLAVKLRNGKAGTRWEWQEREAVA